MSHKVVIVIPARYSSSRLPGKPLLDICGQSMIARVYEVAQRALLQVNMGSILIATDDERIATHAKHFNADVVMTDKSCVSGSNRVLHAIKDMKDKPEVIINLQGDEPLLPPHFVTSLIHKMISHPEIEVCTPVVQLSFDELEALRLHKKNNPFSGTTAIVNDNQRALWFSKQIIPAIRNENKLRDQSSISPIFRHIGLYAYRYQALKRFDSFSEGHYEHLEGLEQLRFIENNIPIHTIKVAYDGWPQMSGVDTEDDLAHAQSLLKAHSQLFQI